MRYQDLVKSMRPFVYFPGGNVGAVGDSVGGDLMNSGMGSTWVAGTPRQGGGIAALGHGPSWRFNGGSEILATTGSGGQSEAFNSANLTIVAWVNRWSTGSVHSVVQRVANGTAFFQWRLESDNLVNFIPANAVNCKSTKTVTDARSHMLAVTVTNQVDVRHYIDGTFDNLVTSGTGVPTSGSHALYFGTLPTAGQGFNGLIGHIAYWKRVLSPGEIRRLYTVGCGATA